MSNYPYGYPRVKITGLGDCSEGPLCGDCVGRLLEGRWPVDGWQCPMCRRIWFRPLPNQAVTATSYSQTLCLLCYDRFLEDEGHACPKLPIPRRREAIMATRAKQ